jgi:hypothetical protein
MISKIIFAHFLVAQWSIEKVPFSEEVSQLLLNKYSIYEIFLYGGNLNARKFFLASNSPWDYDCI